MDGSIWQRLFTKIGIAIMAIALVDIIYINWWVIKSQNSNIKNQSLAESRVIEKKIVEPSPLPTSSPTPKTQSKEVSVSEPHPPAGGEKETQTIIQTAQKEIFIPIGSGSTQNNNYEDLAGLEVTIDTNKYPSIDSVVFEASIWVQDGNGKMFAQLYNVSDKHPVWNSEISTSSSKATLTSSPTITLEKGSRTYRVQAKTNLTSYAAHVDNARIKITLR